MTTSTATKKPERLATSVDAIKLLTDDHKGVHALFQKYLRLAAADSKTAKKAKGDERVALAEQNCEMLTIHATIEAEIFYPAARAAKVDADLLDEAEVEHASCKELITQIRSMNVDDELYDAKVTVLNEYIYHHVKEEQDEIFPKCRKSSIDLDVIGSELSDRKDALMAASP